LVTAQRSGGVYVCGSRKEEFGLAIVEAMAAGLPVVVPTIGGPVTYIEDGWTGFAVDTADPSAIAEGLLAARRVAADVGRARAARRMVRERFTIQRMADVMAELYGELSDRPLTAGATLDRSMATPAAVGS
jgi:glycosyltransferase involved in cell wall biosynthesis